MPTTRTSATRCPVCSRLKEEAIAEQVSKRKSCGCDNCIFLEEIGKALDNFKKIRVRALPKAPKAKIRRKE